MILNLTIVYLCFSFNLFYSFHSASGYLVVWVSGVDCLGTSTNRRIPPRTLPAFPAGVSGDSNLMGPHCRLDYIKSGWRFGTFGLLSVSYMGCHPNPIDELILFKVKTTNQINHSMILDPYYCWCDPIPKFSICLIAKKHHFLGAKSTGTHYLSYINQYIYILYCIYHIRFVFSYFPWLNLIRSH